MKLMLRTNGEGIPTLILRYHPEEWRLLEQKWQELGLQRRTTENLWGCGWKGEFYKETNSIMENMIKELFNAEGLRYRIFSDINSQVFHNYRVNIGILRVVPSSEDYTVKAPLPVLLNVEDLIQIRDTLANAVRLILKVVTNAECNIKFIINGKELGGETTCVS
jgi:hypothetical protein